MSEHGWTDEMVLESRGIIRRLLREPALDGTEREAIEKWLASTRPPEETYSAVMRGIMEGLK